MKTLKGVMCLFERNHQILSMEPLYPQNIVERTFPFLREQREKAEKELRLNPEVESTLERRFDELAFDDENLYVDVPYEGGSTGKHLSTFA